MNTFEKELEIDYMEVCNDLDTSSDLGMISYMESGKIVTGIKKIYDKVIEMIQKIINRIKSIFVKNDQKKIDVLEKSFKANPSLKNKKVKVKDYRKVEKLERDTFKLVNKCKTKEQVEKVQEGYSKKRKILLAAIPVIGITGAGILMFLKSKNKKNINDLESMETTLEQEKADAEKSAKEREELKAKTEENLKKIKELDKQIAEEKAKTIDLLNSKKIVEEATQQAKIKAESELIKDINSTLNEIEKEDGSYAVNYLLHEVDLISGMKYTGYKNDEFANEIIKKNPKNKYVDMYSKLSTLKNSNPEKYEEITSKLNKK